MENGDSHFFAESPAEYYAALREAARIKNNGADWEKEKLINTPNDMAGIVHNPLRTLMLIRGLPGAGKSTLARAICKGYNLSNFYKSPAVVHFEEDMFFHDKNGKYVFDKNKVEQAQNWCFDAAKTAMMNGLNLVVVSNKFIRLFEMQPYREIAKQLNYACQEIICMGNYPNIHGRSDADIERMRKHFQYRPSEYGITAITKP